MAADSSPRGRSPVVRLHRAEGEGAAAAVRGGWTALGGGGQRAWVAAISRPLAAGDGVLDPFVDGFVEQRVLADLLFRRRARRLAAGLVVCGGKAYRLREAVRVVGRADGDGDPYGLTGAVETLAELTRAGASVSGRAMQLGSASYVVERGVLASAGGSSSREAPEWPVA